MQMLTVKRGDTFAFYANITDKAGDPIVGIESKLKSEVRDASKKMYATLSVTAMETGGQYLFQATSTEQWPEKCTLYMDIQYTDDIISSSETIGINVEGDITQ